MTNNSYDVVVIGGGPGGYVAAIRCAQLGQKVALVEEQHLGGICLNWGCIPTKALLRVSEVYHTLQHLDEYGLSAKGVSFDLKKIVKRSRDVAAKLSGGIGHLMKKHKIEVIDGRGMLNGKNTVKVTNSKGKKLKDITAKNIILATGARARILPGLEPDGKQVLTYKEAMVPESMPKSLLVIGSGAIGIEFASFYQNMGVQVTVVELMDRILPVEDAEISKLAKRQFEDQGMNIITGASVTGIKKSAKQVTAEIDKGGKTQQIKVDRVIVAAGIVANSEKLGLEATNIELERGHVVTNGHCQTAEPHVYAIGDLTGGPWLAHKASHEGVIAAEHIAGHKVHPMDKSTIPGCTYCRPQIASVGLTEQAAIDAGHEVKVGRFPFSANGKAIAMGETDGLVKTVFDATTGELLGAHLIGAEVTEMINGFLVGKTLEATELDLMHTIFPHPTLSEMMHESVLDAFAKALHI